LLVENQKLLLVNGYSKIRNSNSKVARGKPEVITWKLLFEIEMIFWKLLVENQKLLLENRSNILKIARGNPKLLPENRSDILKIARGKPEIIAWNYSLKNRNNILKVARGKSEIAACKIFWKLLVENQKPLFENRSPRKDCSLKRFLVEKNRNDCSKKLPARK